VLGRLLSEKWDKPYGTPKLVWSVGYVNALFMSIAIVRACEALECQLVR
jgi:hypothetical protein